MTIFSDNPHDRRIERFMTAIPNFKPRGVGVRFSESQVLITITAATPTEILAETMRQIRCPPFRKRFNEYIESEEKPMTYINEKHRARFELAAKNISKTNYALLSALYLLTADQRLWSCCKHHINNGCVFFENIKLNNCTERAYTLYCAAKDLTLGTKHITVSDLSDADLVPPTLFRTICNAMAMLDAAEIDKAILRNKMAECISQKYSELGNECCTAHKLKAELGSLSDVTERLNRTVSEIRLHPDKTADLILLNGQIIRKEKIHATDSGRSTEGGAGNRTDHIGQGEHQKPLSSLACCSILPSFHEARGTTQQL